MNTKERKKIKTLTSYYLKKKKKKTVQYLHFFP